MIASATLPLRPVIARDEFATDPRAYARLALAEAQLASAEGRILRLAGGTNLARFADASVDVVVSGGALAGPVGVAEVARILRPGGVLAFAEPALAPAGSALRRLQRAVGLVGGGELPRDVWNDLRAAGFVDLVFEHQVLAGRAGLPSAHVVGTARRGAALVSSNARHAPLVWKVAVPAAGFFG